MLQLSQRFPQKRAFITGAASGLGLALCKELAADGWVIGMSDINAISLKKQSDHIAQLGAKTFTYGLDVSDKDAYKQVVEMFLSDVGGIDLLVNNAGVGDGGYVEEYGLDNWDWLLSINLHGVIYGNALFIPQFKKQKSGAIINIASAAAFTSLPRMAAYNVSKAGVRALSETMDAELNHHGIQVSCVMPTFFKTSVMQHARGNKDEIEMSKMIFATSDLTPERVAKYVLKKVGKKRFHIVLPADAKFMFFMKGFLPSVLLRLFRLGEKNKEAVRKRLTERYAKADANGKVDHDYLNEVFRK
ncbi:MAG: SDR family NAD(P)-dependent oxidoreductase [Flavobacteriales bacterium]|nr:SDR family NAD(P)-dependent oxidoreductase [Flavobacteriales bacterium]